MTRRGLELYRFAEVRPRPPPPGATAAPGRSGPGPTGRPAAHYGTVRPRLETLHDSAWVPTTYHRSVVRSDSDRDSDLVFKFELE